MRFDRPYLPTVVNIGAEFREEVHGAGAYGYFIDGDRTGLVTVKYIPPASPTWYKTLEIPEGPGCLQLAVMTWQNEAASNRTIQSRMTREINTGSPVIMQDGGYTLSAFREGGYNAAGRLLWDANTNVIGMALDEFYFNDGFLLETFVSINVRAAISLKYYLT